MRADVGEPSALERLIRKAGAAQGTISVLVNNAAIPGYKTAEALTLPEWERVWNVNVRACWLTAKLGWKFLRAAGGASIINISSVHARATSSSSIPYAATKAALLAFTRSLAIDGGPHNIRANAICPGLIQTAANAGATKQAPQKTVEAADKSQEPGLEFRVDRLAIVKSDVGYVNKTANPAYRVFLADTNATLTNLSSLPTGETAVAELSGKFMNSGPASLSFKLLPTRPGPD